MIPKTKKVGLILFIMFLGF